MKAADCASTLWSRRRPLLLLLLSLIGLATPAPTYAADSEPRSLDSAELSKAAVVYLDVHASTWRPRGRISFGIVPSVKMKLASAGFVVTEDPETPHDLALKVEYREIRGKQISINSYGTEIECEFLLMDPQFGSVLSGNIHESPAYAEMITAPYVEVVERFETNSYFYYLGYLIRGWTDARMDRTGGLILAMDRQFDRERHPREGTPLDTLLSPAETFPDLDLHFAEVAQENGVEELGRLKDARAIDLLVRLLSHPSRRLRLKAVIALSEFDAPSVEPVMRHVALEDSDADVREAAAAVLRRQANRSSN